jgi:hypothetical protein
MELIKSATFFRNGHNEESYFLVVFNNSRLSQAYYVTGQENMVIEDIESFENIHNNPLGNLSYMVDDNIVDEILNIFPPKARNLKTLKRAIKSSLERYEPDYVKYNAEYTVINAKRSYLKYFLGALEGNWGEEYAQKKKLAKTEVKKPQIDLNLVDKSENENDKILKLNEFYNTFTKEEKQEFKMEVFNEIDKVSDAPLPHNVKETMYRNSNYRYIVLEKMYKNKNEGVEIKEKFNNISQFGIRVYKELVTAKLEEYVNEVSFSLKTFEFCDIDDEKVKIYIKYNNNEKSLIKLIKKRGGE